MPEVIERLDRRRASTAFPAAAPRSSWTASAGFCNCYNKATADEWLDVMRQAHRAGLRTTATMMYGTVETMEERIEHLCRLRELQDETGGFTAFIAWSYQPQHTELGGDGGDRRSNICARWRSRGSCSTTSTTCRRRG